jgi:hypothetical protein
MGKKEKPWPFTKEHGETIAMAYLLIALEKTGCMKKRQRIFHH